MALRDLIPSLPKVELHVHLEGSTRPETLLKLARRHGVSLPADDLEGLKRWYQFKDFPHFATIYWKCAECLKTPDDIELIGREFLIGQAEQNVLHSEVTYTPLTQFRQCAIPFDQQLEALNRAMAWGREELGVTMSLTIDIPREACTEDESLLVADWAIEGFGNGVTAFGLGGAEVGFPPEQFEKAFDRARSAGLPSAPHAGETEGPSSIWGSLRNLGAERIGHGVRCLEDEALVEHLVETQITLEVCPTSNVCLGVVPNMAAHPIDRLLKHGLNVTLNSDDPPMFSTSLNQEFVAMHETFGWGLEEFETVTLNAAKASFLPEEAKQKLIARIEDAYVGLKSGEPR